ncbi:ABC transporter permease [Ornithobacterium rhinotracheale]|uniref:ABC transporter permease n=1 Tax=Ornithobacterium rhinotracheale TaxID=28251 RepID=UPI001FF6F7CB|nr:FtsX-like permease family protein [Ornithobacterium rhinotracheale]MCK0200119.1 ABC transporter permease [Ornithobacterium rhinotracheale]
MLRNWLKIAFRNYKKNALTTFINVFGLTVGLVGFLLIIFYWNHENSFEEWNPERENVYQIEIQQNKNDIWAITSYPLMLESNAKIPEIEDFALIQKVNNFNLYYGDKKAMNVNSTSVSNDFFKLFPYKIIAGSTQNGVEKDKIFLEKKVAQQLFGDDYANAIGKEIKLFNQFPAIVAAVYELPEGNTEYAYNAISYSIQLDRDKELWGSFNYKGFFKIKPGSNIKNIEKQMTDILFTNFIEKEAQRSGNSVEDVLESMGIEKQDIRVYLTRLDKAHLDSKGKIIGTQDNTSLKKNLQILIGLCILILVLTAINFINLKTAQASQRAKEVGVRKALGSSRLLLISQFVFETFILCLISLLLTITITEYLLPIYAQFLGKEIQLDYVKTLAYAFAIIIGMSLLAGIIPAIYLANFKPINTLKGNFSRSKNGIWLRNGILVLQLVISGFFIINSLLVNQQVNYLMNKDLGFQGDQIVMIDFKDFSQNNALRYQTTKAELLKIKGVEDVTFSRQRPGKPTAGISSVEYNFKNQEKSINAEQGAVDYNFFKFYHIKFVAGKDFNPQIASDTASGLIVNQAFVREMELNDKDAIGKKIDGYGIEHKIIGVVEDYHFHNATEEIKPIFHNYYNRTWMRNDMPYLAVKINQNDVAGTLKKIENFWSQIDPENDFSYTFLNEDYAETFTKIEQQRTLFSILNFMVLLISLLGLFGLSALLVEQKMKNIAIRKTLGASDKTLVWELTRPFIIISLLASFISIPLSYWFITKWLQDYAYRISIGVLPFLVGVFSLLILALVVTGIKAYRATQRDLVKYLKYE